MGKIADPYFQPLPLMDDLRALTAAMKPLLRCLLLCPVCLLSSAIKWNGKKVLIGCRKPSITDLTWHMQMLFAAVCISLHTIQTCTCDILATFLFYVSLDMFFCVFCLFVCLSVFLCMFVCLSVCKSVCLCMYAHMYLWMSLYLCLSHIFKFF
jgi:hypothetical protein